VRERSILTPFFRVQAHHSSWPAGQAGRNSICGSAFVFRRKLVLQGQNLLVDGGQSRAESQMRCGQRVP
jgi:hypothetical protein